VIVAVVPAKDLADAKARLSPSLTPPDRRALFSAMLEDVLVALRSSPSIDQVLVVTHEPEFIRLAKRHGAEVCLEPANAGHTEAVRLAVSHLRSSGRSEAMLTIPGDVPLVTEAEIEAVVAASLPAPSVVLVPSRNGLGTNAALLRPPDAMRLRFGEPSFPNHVKCAKTLGLATRILELPGLGLDVDTRHDLDLLCSRECGPSTRRLLQQLSGRGVLESSGIHAH
jgi:2-phospho-L-lactate/phosphoenolpyruvate guanylyltransferase